jgi:hypothetical protein
MKTKRQHLFRGLLLSGAMALTAPHAALALNTPACTQITNRAYIDYEIGGVKQTQIASKDSLGNDLPTSFFVGVNVDLTVTKVEATLLAITYAPGAINATMNFTLQNASNTGMLYDLTATNLPDGTASPIGAPPHADNFNATVVSVNGALAASTTTAEIPRGGSLVIPVVVSIPAGQVNNDLSVWKLVAQSKLPGTGATVVGSKNVTLTGDNIGGALCTSVATGAKTANIAVVSRNGNGTDTVATDYGQASDRNAILVTAAGLTITKSSKVHWDPVNLFASPKAIPNAVVTYTITIANANGAATASNIQVVDDLTAMVNTATNLHFGNEIAANTSFNNINDDTDLIKVNCSLLGADYGILVNGFCKQNPVAGADGASWNDPTDPALATSPLPRTYRVVASGITVNGNSSATVKYQVTIQ